MTERARLFVDKIIEDNDIRFMKNILNSYLSTRDLSESLQICINNTTEKDPLVILSCQYLDIIPPITQNVFDFSEALKSFIFQIFSIEQILIFSNKEALEYLSNL